MKAYFYLTLLLFVGVNTGRLRVYNNPLNDKAVDLFFLVDETNARMSLLQLGQIKIALNDITTDLQPIGSSPYFGIYFYGARSAVQAVVPFPTTLATAVKANLALKQYATAQANPSTLSLALNLVNVTCQSFCRVNIPRVTILFTSNPDHLAESRVRQLEKTFGMTVIAVGIGSLAHTATLNNLASYPSRFYAVPFGSLIDLLVSYQYVSFLISSVPRPLPVNSSLSVPSTTAGIYYVVQLNTYGFISTNDTVVTYTTNCNDCAVYASLSEPNPTSDNAVQNIHWQYFYVPGFRYSIHYFRIPKNADRFFLSFVGTGMPSVTGIFNVFNMPQMMSFATTSTQTTPDSEISIG
jgi:hypothetical protein